MGTTYKQDKEFIDAIFPKDLLEQAIDWIGANMEPEDVFSEQRLTDWAKDIGMVAGGENG
jgi:hypothetical protein